MMAFIILYTLFIDGEIFKKDAFICNYSENYS